MKRRHKVPCPYCRRMLDIKGFTLHVHMAHVPKERRKADKPQMV